MNAVFEVFMQFKSYILKAELCFHVHLLCYQPCWHSLAVLSSLLLTSLYVVVKVWSTLLFTLI